LLPVRLSELFTPPIQLSGGSRTLRVRTSFSKEVAVAVAHRASLSLCRRRRHNDWRRPVDDGGGLPMLLHRRNLRSCLVCWVCPGGARAAGGSCAPPADFVMAGPKQ